MFNKSGPTSTLHSNGQPHRGFSLLSTPAALYVLLRKRSWLRTTAQLLVVSIIAFGGVGIIRVPHTKLPAASAQDPGDDWTGTDIAPSGNLTLDNPTIGQAPDAGPLAQNAMSAPFNTSDPNYFTDKAASDLANPSPAPAQRLPIVPHPSQALEFLLLVSGQVWNSLRQAQNKMMGMPLCQTRMAQWAEVIMSR